MSPRQILKSDLFCSIVTLKIRTRSSKPNLNQVFIMLKCYVHVNLVPTTNKLHTDANANRIHTKNNMPFSVCGGGGGGGGGGGAYIILFISYKCLNSIKTKTNKLIFKLISPIWKGNFYKLFC